MAIFERGAVRIHYEERGQGFPVLALAPGALRSSIELWEGRALEPLKDLAPHFRVIAMDQRNAGSSLAPIADGDGWHSYTDDQLALMDHLGIERFAAVGMCVGGSFISGLAKQAPERVAAAVMVQPMGLENNRDVFKALFRSWQADVQPLHPEATDAVFDALEDALFSGGFQFNATQADAKRFAAPLLVLMGDDIYHPRGISRRLVQLAPRSELISDWKTGTAQVVAKARVIAFLQQHTAG